MTVFQNFSLLPRKLNEIRWENKAVYLFFNYKCRSKEFLFNKSSLMNSKLAISNKLSGNYSHHYRVLHHFNIRPCTFIILKVLFFHLLKNYRFHSPCRKISVRKRGGNCHIFDFTKLNQMHTTCSTCMYIYEIFLTAYVWVMVLGWSLFSSF